MKLVSFFTVVAVGLGLFIVAGAATVVIASTSKPGEPLFSVKRSVEEARMLATIPTTGKINLELSFASERLKEIRKVLGVTDSFNNPSEITSTTLLDTQLGCTLYQLHIKHANALASDLYDSERSYAMMNLATAMFRQKEIMNTFVIKISPEQKLCFEQVDTLWGKTTKMALGELSLDQRDALINRFGSLSPDIAKQIDTLLRDGQPSVSTRGSDQNTQTTTNTSLGNPPQQVQPPGVTVNSQTTINSAGTTIMPTSSTQVNPTAAPSSNTNIQVEATPGVNVTVDLPIDTGITTCSGLTLLGICIGN